MKFKHKPMVVDAVQLVSDTEFETKTGRCRGRPGDWLITTEDSEKHVCPRATFEAVYEPADLSIRRRSVPPWETVPAKTDDVFHRLASAARDMRIVRYIELASDVGLAAVGIGQPLGYIRDEVCRARGLPWLTAIAVAKDGLPSGGFLPGDSSISLNPDDFKVWWKAMVLQVFATDWSTVECRSVGDR